MRKIDYSLYLVTDRKLMSTTTLEEAVEQAIIGGCTLVQLREKSVSSFDFLETAIAVKKITDRYNVPLIINDRVDIALASNATGVHLGQRDIPAKIARQIVGVDKLLGVSVSTLAEAAQAQKDGADYLGVGAMFVTGTKTDAKLVSMEELSKIRNAVSVPIVAIGGINERTVSLFDCTKIDGLAVVSAVIAQNDIAMAAKELKAIFKKGT